jgi:hypothetical protein
MKKIKLLLLAAFSIYAFSGINMAHGFSVIKPTEPSLASVKYLKASEFVKLSAKDYTALTGKKLNFFQRLSFNLTRVKMKHDLKKNPDLKVTDYINGDGRTFQIDLLWLLLGTITGPIGVLIAYVAKVEPYKRTSAWIGFGIFLLILVIFGKSIF